MRSLFLFLVTLLVAASPVQALTEEQLIDVYTHAYDASGKLSKADFIQLARCELLSADWNAGLAPMLKGLRDPGMVPTEWARSARHSLCSIDVPIIIVYFSNPDTGSNYDRINVGAKTCRIR